MKDRMIGVLIVWGICMFCGFVGISDGLASIFPPLDQVAAPIICGNQSLIIDQHTSSYRPGETNFSITAHCFDSKQDQTGPVQLVAGIIYSLVFLVIMIVLNIRYSLTKKHSAADAGQAVPRPPRAKRTRPADANPPESIDEKLAKLKQLREANLITDEDFEKKKAEILQDL